MNRLLFGLLVLENFAQGASIRDVDFKNFIYPLPRDLDSVPGALRWMHLKNPKRLVLHDGQYKFCGDQGCPSAWLNTVDFGNISGLPGTSAIVRVWYSTGGTANWQYLYVVAFRSGKPNVAAWLETGSRAAMGLRRASVDRGDLVLVVNDPEKRQGDCCSTGTITYRYRWRDGSLHQIGSPDRADDPQ